MNIRIAIHSVELRGTYEDTLEYFDPIEAVIASFISSDREVHLISFDMMHSTFGRTAELRSLIAEQLNVSANDIVLHYTHTHTGPRDEDMAFADLTPVLVSAIKKNQEQAVAGKMAFVSVDTQGRWNINRRKFLSEEFGSMTVWSGLEERDGHLDGQRIISNRLKNWFGEDFKHAIMDEVLAYDEKDRDTKLQGIVFKSLDDEMLGGFVRFAAHPAISGHTTDRRYSADFPGFLRRILHQELRGEFLYLTGPCGNICPWELGDWAELPVNDNRGSMLPLGPQKDPDASFAEAQRIAQGLSEEFINALPADDAYSALDSIDLQVNDFDLQLRGDISFNLDEAAAAWEALYEQMGDKSQFSLRAYKDQVDQLNFLSYQKYFQERGYITEADVAKGSVLINLPSFRFNDVVVQGLPGESFYETAYPARDVVEQLGKKFISFSFANGSVCYLPTEEERPLGDYETVYCVAAAGQVDALTDAVAKSSKAILEQGEACAS